MYKVAIRGMMVLGASVFLFSCETQDAKHKQSVEEKLISSFRSAPEKTIQRVQGIVLAAKDKNYPLALNELGLLSVTNRLSKPQKLSVTSLMRQLRFDMEEEEFNAQISPAAE